MLANAVLKEESEKDFEITTTVNSKSVKLLIENSKVDWNDLTSTGKATYYEKCECEEKMKGETLDHKYACIENCNTNLRGERNRLVKLGDFGILFHNGDVNLSKITRKIKLTSLLKEDFTLESKNWKYIQLPRYNHGDTISRRRASTITVVEKENLKMEKCIIVARINGNKYKFTGIGKKALIDNI